MSRILPFAAATVALLTFASVPVARAQNVAAPDPDETLAPPLEEAESPAPSSAAEPVEEHSVEAVAERPLRKGFLAGAAFGLGSVKTQCDGQGCGHYSGIGFSLDAGWAFSPKWALVGELWFTGGVGGNSDEAGQLLSFSANARVWVLERFWLQAGLATTSFDMLRTGQGTVLSASGSGLVLGAGAELWRSHNGHLVIDLRAKLGLLSVKDPALADQSDKSVSTRQTTAMVTLSWY